MAANERLGTKILKHPASGNPEVLAAVSVRPLRRSNFTSQGNGADFARGVLEGGAQVAPEAVDYLRAGFHGFWAIEGNIIYIF